MSTTAEQFDLDDDRVWDALDTLDRARTAHYARVGAYTTLGETERRERGRRYLASMDPSIQGASGSGKLWRAAIALVHGFDIEPNQALELLITDFNPRCRPEWSVAELQRACWRAHRAREREPRGYLLTRGRAA